MTFGPDHLDSDKGMNGLGVEPGGDCRPCSSVRGEDGLAGVSESEDLPCWFLYDSSDLFDEGV